MGERALYEIDIHLFTEKELIEDDVGNSLCVNSSLFVSLACQHAKNPACQVVEPVDKYVLGNKRHNGCRL